VRPEKRTRLGKEGAESMVVIGGFAFFGEISVRLFEIEVRSVVIAFVLGKQTWMPCSRQ
jgi:hypothetical protein